MNRPPLVAGLFYPRLASALIKEIERCFLHQSGPGALPQVNQQGPNKIVAALAPHAGYRYSGPTAARTYYALAQDGIPETVVIIAPAHFRPGAPLAIWTGGFWETPLGRLTVDDDLVRALIASDPNLQGDNEPHWGYAGGPEHSIEVQLPFLQLVYADKPPAIVCIAVSERDLRTLLEAGQAMAEVIREYGKRVVLLVSADLTHYEPHERAKVQDKDALDRFVERDPVGLYRTIVQYPTQSDLLTAIPVLETARRLGVTSGRVLGYATSGEETGDFRQVVGYGSAVLEREGSE
ncbi:MAG: AmmeMemoRadiSam system protein B [Armatimonadetes bacterium]|nr:AmmeMemoRadiSam system protein B [Armatimonadota bacterium]MDW8121895.1 AmmeMemoRadiSam system protein B [Armatimonadota bacterium]